MAKHSIHSEANMNRKFVEIFTVENLYLAYLDARKTKRNRRGCFEFERHLGANLQRLHDELKDGSFRPGPRQAHPVTQSYGQFHQGE